jgi:hypothetical protein
VALFANDFHSVCPGARPWQKARGGNWKQAMSGKKSGECRRPSFPKTTSTPRFRPNVPCPDDMKKIRGGKAFTKIIKTSAPLSCLLVHERDERIDSLGCCLWREHRGSSLFGMWLRERFPIFENLFPPPEAEKILGAPYNVPIACFIFLSTCC